MADPNEDFVSFEKALRDLKMQSEELKKLVSEGEIRAFRDGQSMKFKREDIESLAGGDADELVFAESLEDDTGMVTEELSDEETLLAEDDFDDEPAPRRASRAAAQPRRAAAVAVAEEPQKEHVFFTATAILTALVAVYGFMAVYSIATETPPSGLLAVFAKN